MPIGLRGWKGVQMSALGAMLLFPFISRKAS
jgi:hypothetical protein